MPISKETQVRIKKDAKRHAQSAYAQSPLQTIQEAKYIQDVSMYTYIHVASYYAQRAQQLESKLEAIIAAIDLLDDDYDSGAVIAKIYTAANMGVSKYRNNLK